MFNKRFENSDLISMDKLEEYLNDILKFAGLKLVSKNNEGQDELIYKLIDYISQYNDPQYNPRQHKKLTFDTIKVYLQSFFLENTLYRRRDNDQKEDPMWLIAAGAMKTAVCFLFFQVRICVCE